MQSHAKTLNLHIDKETAMKPILKIVTIITAGLVLALGVSAYDLPVKRVKGKEYYYYKVKKGESLYGISKKL